jgi:hypothetical protein
MADRERGRERDRDDDERRDRDRDKDTDVKVKVDVDVDIGEDCDERCDWDDDEWHRCRHRRRKRCHERPIEVEEEDVFNLILRNPYSMLQAASDIFADQKRKNHRRAVEDAIDILDLIEDIRLEKEERRRRTTGEIGRTRM